MRLWLFFNFLLFKIDENFIRSAGPWVGWRSTLVQSLRFQFFKIGFLSSMKFSVKFTSAEAKDIINHLTERRILGIIYLLPKGKKREQLKFICTPLLFSWRVNRTIFPFLLSFIVIVASSVFQYTLTRGIGPKDLETFLLSKARLVQNHNFQLMSRTCWITFWKGRLWKSWLV